MVRSALSVFILAVVWFGAGGMDRAVASEVDHVLAWLENDGNSPPSFVRRVITNSAFAALWLNPQDMDGDGPDEDDTYHPYGSGGSFSGGGGGGELVEEDWDDPWLHGDDLLEDEEHGGSYGGGGGLTAAGASCETTSRSVVWRARSPVTETPCAAAA